MPKPSRPAAHDRLSRASLYAWMVETYFACCKPAGQAADANPYNMRVRLKFKPDGSLLNAPKLVNPPSGSGAEAAGKEGVAGCQGI